MPKPPIIRYFTAVFMLLTMALSVTPKAYLHHWFAAHKDVSVKKEGAGQPQVSKQLFHCNCDNLVAESPFTDHDHDLKLTTFSALSIQQGSKPVSLYSSAPCFFSLRGPPVS